ncbi:UDP-N-acetyl-D-mannosamine dehydrogenase [Succinimonas sp.]|uniref:UDP-N-acetyl-D-mannosamine dehydrogenase n=1 Tax=Succinimonas sp. TaxID=1936151 RepID=UPI00386591C0
MKLCICGLGYIGLPTAAMFARNGVSVHGVEINQHAIDTINQGKIHIVEPGLGEVVHKAVSDGLLVAANQPCEADAFIICVPTPFTGDNHEPDLSFVDAATGEIAPFIRKGNTVILESTSPVGTTERVAEILQKNCPDLKIAREDSEYCDVYVAYCPERVLPGKIMSELVDNDRIVGGINQVSARKAADIYGIFVKGELLLTNARTGEMSKLTENAFRDVNIAFANELSLICDRLHIDVWELISLANHHPRVNILNPGPGVGGHCIAVDPWFIVSKTPDLARIIETARKVNDHKPEWVKEQVREAVAGSARKDSLIACLGLAFKPDIDDLRESPAVRIARDLAREFPGRVIAAEPHIAELPAVLSKSGVRLTDIAEALKADVVLLLVDHREFRAIKPEFAPEQTLIDTRGLWKS